MATRKFNRKPVDIREIGGVLGFFLSAFADEIKRNGMPQDPVAYMHNLVHGSLDGLQQVTPPPSFENRELHFGLIDGIHEYMHARGDHVHGEHGHAHAHTHDDGHGHGPAVAEEG